MDYIGADNPVAAIELDDAFEEEGRTRPAAANLVPTWATAGTREIVVRPSYIMVYRIEDEGGTVAVLRVLHAAQQWPAVRCGVDG